MKKFHKTVTFFHEGFPYQGTRHAVGQGGVSAWDWIVSRQQQSARQGGCKARIPYSSEENLYKKWSIYRYH